MNRAGLAAVCLNERIKGLKEDFICLITEPHNYRGKEASLPRNCKVVPYNLREKECRAAIIASPNIEIVEISDLCTKDSAVAYCNIDNKRILVCSGYLDITQPVLQDWMDKVVKYADSKLSLIHILTLPTKA